MKILQIDEITSTLLDHLLTSQSILLCDRCLFFPLLFTIVPFPNIMSDHSDMSIVTILHRKRMMYGCHILNTLALPLCFLTNCLCPLSDIYLFLSIRIRIIRYKWTRFNVDLKHYYLSLWVYFTRKCWHFLKKKEIRRKCPQNKYFSFFVILHSYVKLFY